MGTVRNREGEDLKKRRSKYSSKSRAEECARKAMSDYIRERDKWTCITCGKKGDKYNIDAGHFLDCRYEDLRYNEVNVHAQCVYCNKYLNGAPDIYRDKMFEKYGQAVIDNLLSRRYLMRKRTVDELLKIEQHYKSKLIELLDARMLPASTHQHIKGTPRIF